MDWRTEGEEGGNAFSEEGARGGPRGRSPVGLVLLITAVTAIATPVSASLLLRDPAAVVGAPFYTGAVSNLGVLMWWSTATVCLLSWLVLSRLGQDGEERRFLLCAGALTGLLAVDDLLLLHETVAPIYLGVQSTTVYAIYGATVLVIFVSFRRVILGSDFLLLLIAGCFFAGSILIDLAHEKAGLGFYGIGFLEDGCKLLGIAGWLSYFASLSINQLAGTRRFRAFSPGPQSASVAPGRRTGLGTIREEG